MESPPASTAPAPTVTGQAPGAGTAGRPDAAELASDVDTAWTQEGDHGDTFQRVSAFDRGRGGGVEVCLPTS